MGDIFDQPTRSEQAPAAQATPQGKGDIFDQPTRSEMAAGRAPSATAPATPAQPTLWQAAKQVLNGESAGFDKGLAQLVDTVGDVASLGVTHIPWVQHKLGTNAEEMHNYEQALKPKGTDEQIGGAIEQGGEFLIGEGELKALMGALGKLPMAERLAAVTKLTALAEKYPALSRIIKTGLSGATVGGVVGGVHEGTQGAIAGAEGGGAGGVIGGALAEGTGKLVSKFAQNAKQPLLQEAVSQTAKQTSEGAGVATPKAGGAVRDLLEETAENVKGKSKAQYAVLDQASGGRWQRFDDELKNVRDKMSEVAGIDDEKFVALEAKQKSLEGLQSKLVDSLVKEGKIAPDLAEEAKANYKHSQALYDVSAQLRGTTKGLPPELAAKGSSPEMIDPKQFRDRLMKLRDSGRLEQAVGLDNTKRLLQVADEAMRHKDTAIKYQKVMGWIAGRVAEGAGIGAGFGGGKMMYDYFTK